MSDLARFVASITLYMKITTLYAVFVPQTTGKPCSGLAPLPSPELLEASFFTPRISRYVLSTYLRTYLLQQTPSSVNRSDQVYWVRPRHLVQRSEMLHGDRSPPPLFHACPNNLGRQRRNQLPPNSIQAI